MKMMAFVVSVVFLIVAGGATAIAQDDAKELESNCDAGNLDACVKLGEMFTSGPAYDNVPQDYARAVSLFQKACDGGISEGCNELASCYDSRDRCYRSGKGVQEDLPHAASLYEKACAGESADGCFDLGRAYADGRGVPQDYTRASSYFELTCSLGGGSGCRRLTELHHPQEGVLKDTARWAAFVEKSCGPTWGNICLKLGLAYDLGLWVPKDSDHATELFKKGCFWENKESCNLINR
jgi:TPR repeat protein